MKTIIFYVVALVCLITTKLSAQETFEERAKAISKNIERITTQQKDSLKIEVEKVDAQLEKGEITSAEASTLKKQYAENRAKNIETKVALEEERLSVLVKDKVNGKVNAEDKNKTYIKVGRVFEVNSGNGEGKDTIMIGKKRHYRDYKRTTSQFVFAGGLNRLVEDGAIDDENFRGNSDFYELGFTYNTRILRNNNLLHFKYGLSLQYNNLRPKNDKIFVADGNKTTLVESPIDLKLSRFRYVNLVVPMHLEFDFTPKSINGDKTYFLTHKSFRVGLGGFAGVNVKEKQVVKYELDDQKVKQKTKGDFNVNDFVYGVSAYVGYGQVSVYAKYDLQTVFAHNDLDQNNLSIGIRFDFN